MPLPRCAHGANASDLTCYILPTITDARCLPLRETRETKRRGRGQGSSWRKTMSGPRTRTYTGCWTCRKRRKKCTGERPACQRCKDHGRACEGYEIRLRWGAGIASRGRLTGAKTPIEKSTQPLQRQSLPASSQQTPADAAAVTTSAKGLVDRLLSPEDQNTHSGETRASPQLSDGRSQTGNSGICCETLDEPSSDEGHKLFRQCKLLHHNDLSVRPNEPFD
jgi:hypothetical protein